MFFRRIVPCCAVLVLASCASTAPGDDSGARDAARDATGGRDVAIDDSVLDANATDEGTVDSGTDLDASDVNVGSDGDVDAVDAVVDTGPVDAAPATYRNLVLNENGDPFCARFGNRYYVYLPDQVRRNGMTVGGRVMGFTSTDLVHWNAIGSVYDNVDEMRGGQHSIGLWAPEVLEYHGHYYLYYASLMAPALDPNVGDKDIEVVESDNPRDFTGGTRTVLLDDNYAFIDPDAFVDPVTDQIYLVFKRRAMQGTGSEIDIRPMSSPTAFSGPRVLVADSELIPNTMHTTEQPTMWRAGNVYYVLFSANDGGGTDYHIAYSTATQPLGPYTFQGTLFRSSANFTPLATSIISPGSSSIVRDGANQTWMVYRQKTTTMDTFADRGVAIDRVTFEPATRSISGSPSKGVDRRAPVPL